MYFYYYYSAVSFFFSWILDTQNVLNVIWYLFLIKLPWAAAAFLYVVSFMNGLWESIYIWDIIVTTDMDVYIYIFERVYLLIFYFYIYDTCKKRKKQRKDIYLVDEKFI